MLRNRSNFKAVAVLMVIAALILAAGAFPVMAGVNNQGANCAGTGIGRTGGSLIDTVADVLGVSRQDIAVERRAGKSLADIAAEKNMDKDQLLNTVLEQKQENLNQALNDGKITQEQYDQCSQLMKERTEQNLTRTDVGPNGQGAGKGKGMQGFSRGGGNGICSGNCQQLGRASTQN